VNDPTVFRRDCFKPNCATTLSINVTVPQGGTFVGLASVFDNVDHHGDIVRRGGFSKSPGSGTRRYCGLDAQGR
jgi:hypothetical protein